MNKRQYVIDMIARMLNTEHPEIDAEAITDRLLEEGLLHLGYGDADIDIVIQKFADNFGTTKTSRQDRWAANRLVTKYGRQAIVGIIDLLAQNSTEKFAPVVNTLAQLEEKFPSVLNFLRNIKGTEEIQV